MKTGIKNIISVILILVLLPLVCAVMIRGGDSVLKQNYDEREKLLPGILAATISENAPQEALKSQAVILRTLMISTKGESAYQEMKLAKLCYKTPESEATIKAVLATENEILYYGKEIARPAFHRISAGRTRSLAEISCDESSRVASLGENAYLHAVDSPWDKEAEGYRTERILYGVKLKILERDSSGYVLWLMNRNEKISGEAFRKKYELNSSNFEVLQKQDKAILTVYGIGHGFGMSQYGASCLALEGKNYREILKYYMNGIQIRRFYE